MTSRREFIDALLAVFCGVALPNVVRETIHVNPLLHATYPRWTHVGCKPYRQADLVAEFSRLVKRLSIPSLTEQFNADIYEYLSPTGAFLRGALEKSGAISVEGDGNTIEFRREDLRFAVPDPGDAVRVDLRVDPDTVVVPLGPLLPADKHIGRVASLSL